MKQSFSFAWCAEIAKEIKKSASSTRKSIKAVGQVKMMDIGWKKFASFGRLVNKTV